MCHCDMFPEPHDAGHIADGVKCETLLVGPRVSPHIWPDSVNEE